MLTAWHIAGSPPGTAALLVAGDLDVAEADQLVDVAIACGEPGVAEVVLDLSAVTYLGSAGIAALLQASAMLSELGVGLRIGRSTPIIDRVLNIVGVDDHLAGVPAD